ncbi:structure-specific endonuclease subunit SLX4 isoform X2 [Antennarius striatus]|uniref:structure-specific endonuclease subunit SLX4 isoform X2 n=1 Tax=Antennarius striatus TaxID=241820 RepID=UPI0035AF93F8
MDDSALDFVDLRSKLLKRNRKKPLEPRQSKKTEHQSCQAGDGVKRGRSKEARRSKCAGTQPLCRDAEQPVVCEGTGFDSAEAWSSAGLRAEQSLMAKDKVLLKMQQFRRSSPQRLLHTERSLAQNPEDDSDPSSHLIQRQESFSADISPEPEDSDEALALQLQQELNREAAQVQTADLEDEGLFFCHICHRNLSHMTSDGRLQHLNRCLDHSEKSASAPALLPPPPPPPRVPDCPICGKNFKSQKSRLTHLKRCSSDMGVTPAVLLQALQRQADETKNTNTLTEIGSAKRKRPANPSQKKPKKKAEPLDEDTMVALALSSSMLEQEREPERPVQKEANAALKWRPAADKGCGKRKRQAIFRPPPFLLVQNAETALTKLQERVSALLVISRSPSPPTPTRCTSSLPGWSGFAPLWQKSTLMDEGSTCQSDFYTPELREFIAPWKSATSDSFTYANDKHEPVQSTSEGTLVVGTMASTLQNVASTPGTAQLPLKSQTLRHPMELADHSMTLSQCAYTDSRPDKEQNTSLVPDLELNSFVRDKSQKQADLCVSKFLPKNSFIPSVNTNPETRQTDKRAVNDHLRHPSVALSRLASDLSSMVNNPQLCDVQLQVDTGEVYFAHSFMVYARCPLLAEMVHECGFGVQEDGMHAAQRVLISEVPAQAVLAFLHYLYTASCSIPASLLPHVLELACRFDLQELQQLCSQNYASTFGDEETYLNQEDNVTNQTDQEFMALLISMWNEDESTDVDERKAFEKDCHTNEFTTDETEICEENVNEEELEEIYEFSATQKKKGEEKEDDDLVEDEGGKEVFTTLTESRSSSTSFLVKKIQNCEDGEASLLHSTSGQPKMYIPKLQNHHSTQTPSSKLSNKSLNHSSASAIDDLSVSLPPASSLPAAGLSVGQGTATLDMSKGLPFMSECQGPHSPESQQIKKEPELIVLSDSSDETDVLLCCHSPSHHSPQTVKNLQRQTQIKTQPVPKPNKSSHDNSSSNLEFSPETPFAQIQTCNQSTLECSPELSWLIPNTPLQHGQSTTTSSTQTRSRMCRTKLFPQGDDLQPSLSVLSPPLPLNRLQTSHSSTTDPSQIKPTEDCIPRIKLQETVSCSSSFDLSFCPTVTNSCDVAEVKQINTLTTSQSKFPHLSSSTSSKEVTPCYIQAQPCSSTPLHTELHLSPAPLATSMLNSNLDKRRTRQGRDKVPTETSPERTELGSFHLSLLSDPSDQSVSYSNRGIKISQRHSDSSHRSGQSEFSSCDNTGSNPVRSDITDELGQSEAAEETRLTEHDVRHSFMTRDDPPIAFNDSWALDVCLDANLKDEQELSLSQQQTDMLCSSVGFQPSPPGDSIPLLNSLCPVADSSTPKVHSLQPSRLVSPDLTTQNTPEDSKSLLDSKIWDAWEEEEVEEVETQTLPLSQRLNPSAQLKTPAPVHKSSGEHRHCLYDCVSSASSHTKRRTLVPITPMPHYSDMDTPELKNKLSRFGVRPLAKRQMILKLKEIHQYTHQLESSDSDDGTSSAGCTAKMTLQPTNLVIAGKKPHFCAQTMKLKDPIAPAFTSPLKDKEEGNQSASQSFDTVSSGTIEESERSNPELCHSSDDESESDVTPSQKRTCLRAVQSFILSDPELYTQILQYQPLVLSQLHKRLKASGIRLSSAKLMDFLDSQCITFTTAKPSHSAPGCRRGKKMGRGAKAVNESKRCKESSVTAIH